MGVFKSTCTTPNGPKSIPKLGNPGIFSIACTLGDIKVDDIKVDDALCDSGASMNVISVEMVKRIGIKDMKPYSSYIMFGYPSSKSSLGLIEDYPLKIGDWRVPTDFMVVEMVKTHNLPLLLGTRFLNTVGASIDFPNKRVTLVHVNNKSSYPIKPFSTEFYGTTAIEEEPRTLNNHHEGIKVVNEVNRNALEHAKYDENILDGECLQTLLDEDKKNVKEKKLSKAKKVFEVHNERNPPSLPCSIFNYYEITSLETFRWRN